MSSPLRLLIVISLAVLLGVIFIPIITTRIILGLVLAVTIGWVLHAIIARREGSLRGPALDVYRRSSEQRTLTRLFEATMNGMREGLLVVNEELEVIASNRAAHQLFPLASDRLESQRLTNLTRNTRIYGAFLDAIKTRSEQSGLRIETAERRMFDLRVVPLTDVDGSGTRGALGVFFDITRLER